MRQAVRSWEEFLLIANLLVEDLQKPEDERIYDYNLIVVDTIDELARMCAEYVIAGMSAGRKGFVHASDFDYGKGWDAIASEFRLKIANLTRLGLGVLFISHVKEGVVKTRTGKEITKLSPDVGQKGMRNWLLGYVEAIVFADIVETKEGEKRILQWTPSETVELGGRFPEGTELPDTTDLSASEFRRVLGMMAG
jgi:hypothetical protein